MRRSRRVHPLLLAAVLYAAGCAVPWNAVALAPRPEPSVITGAEVRVVRLDGTRLILREARIESDSLVTYTTGVLGPESPPVRSAIALNDIRTLEVRSASEVWNRTTFAAILVVVGVVAAIDALSNCPFCE